MEPYLGILGTAIPATITNTWFDDHAAQNLDGAGRSDAAVTEWGEALKAARHRKSVEGGIAA